MTHVLYVHIANESLLWFNQCTIYSHKLEKLLHTLIPSFRYMKPWTLVNNKMLIAIFWARTNVTYYNTCPPFIILDLKDNYTYEHMFFTEKHMFCSKSMHGKTWILNVTVFTKNGLAYLNSYFLYKHQFGKESIEAWNFIPCRNILTPDCKV